MGWLQDEYKVKNPEKYLGKQNPRYLSSWELQFFERLDNHPNVLKWGSEIIVVPYFSPIDQRNRRYMVDIYVEFLKNGKVEKQLIEIKPHNQTIPPKKGKKSKQTYLKEVYTWNVNQAKWKAASRFAKDRGWKFVILTEKHIFN